MTHKQKLLVNFNCCLIMVDNLSGYSSQSKSIKQQGFAVAIKLTIKNWKVFDTRAVQPQEENYDICVMQ